MTDSPTDDLRTVLVVFETGPRPARLLSIDHDGGHALVMPTGSDRWQSVPAWTIVDPPFEMVIDRDVVLDRAVAAARAAAARMSHLEAVVLDAYVTAGADGLTNDALTRRLTDAHLSEFDLSIIPKVRATLLEHGWIDPLPLPERSRRSRREPAHVRRITGLGRLVHVERRLATTVPS